MHICECDTLLTISYITYNKLQVEVAYHLIISHHLIYYYSILLIYYSILNFCNLCMSEIRLHNNWIPEHSACLLLTKQ